jgi:predicted  nucleic acid-binding Zn-ribbon protein
VIYQLKKDIKDNTNKFYQSKNSQSLKTYQTRIKSYKKFTQDDSQKIKQLEDRLMNLNSKYSSTHETVESLNKQIEKIRKEVQL